MTQIIHWLMNRYIPSHLPDADVIRFFFHRLYRKPYTRQERRQIYRIALAHHHQARENATAN